MKTKVYISRRLPEAVMNKFEQSFEIKSNNADRPATRAELEEGIQWADIMVSLLNDNIDANLINLNPKLKAICNYAVGYNNIDVATAKQHKIIVTNTPDVLTETTADFAWALLMAAARRIVEADAIARKGTFPGWAPNYMTGHDIYGKTIGLIGTGRIGSAVAKRAKGFNMTILYTDPIHNLTLEKLGAKQVELSHLLSEADFISLHVPLTDSTKDLINKDEFKQMKSNCILINTARGPVINEEALIWALQNNVIVAAGSVVTKSFKNNYVIIAGNPARIINEWDNYSTKIANYALSTKGLSYNQKKEMILNSGKLVKREYQ